MRPRERSISPDSNRARRWMAGPNGMTFLALDTASPYDIDFDQADGGKRAHYLARWQKTDGTFLTWSELASATIPA